MFNVSNKNTISVLSLFYNESTRIILTGLLLVPLLLLLTVNYRAIKCCTDVKHFCLLRLLIWHRGFGFMKLGIYSLREVSLFGVFLVIIFPYSDFSVFSPNVGKCGPEKLRNTVTSHVVIFISRNVTIVLGSSEFAK